MAALPDTPGFKRESVTGHEGTTDTVLAVIEGAGNGCVARRTESRAGIKAGDEMPLLMVTTARSPPC